jgi:hypothetical protein
MADTAVFTLRLPSDLEGMIDICPGDTRTARIIGIIKFAFEQGYPGTEILDQPQTSVATLAQQIAAIEKKAEYWDWSAKDQDERLDAIEEKLNRRSLGV